jgi:hypothetical protein
VGGQPTEPVESEHLDRQPDFERPEPPGERDPVVSIVDLVRIRDDVLQVVRARRERLRQPGPVADEQAPDVKRLGQPLVRVERDRVGVGDTGEFTLSLVG